MEVRKATISCTSGRARIIGTLLQAGASFQLFVPRSICYRLTAVWRKRLLFPGKNVLLKGGEAKNYQKNDSAQFNTPITYMYIHIYMLLIVINWGTIEHRATTNCAFFNAYTLVDKRSQRQIKAHSFLPIGQYETSP